VFCLLEATYPYLKAFNPEKRVGGEVKYVAKLRTDAWKAVLKSQHPIFPYWFRITWSIFILISFLLFTGLDLYNILKCNRVILFIVVYSIDGVLTILWLSFVILNFTKFRPGKPNEVIKKGNGVSHFHMEQIQQFLTELSIYPQLCVASINFSQFTFFFCTSFFSLSNNSVDCICFENFFSGEIEAVGKALFCEAISFLYWKLYDCHLLDCYADTPW